MRRLTFYLGLGIPIPGTLGVTYTVGTPVSSSSMAIETPKGT